MKFTRKAQAVWQGPGKTGNGVLTTGSGVLAKTPYSFNTRFGEEKGTNPEELIGAAHAGCFAMKLSFVIGEAGFTPETLEVTAEVVFEDGGVSQILLNLNAVVPGMDEESFLAAAEDARKNCPISALLNAEIRLTAHLG